MRILVIPDIHLKPWIFDLADEILKAGKADRAVCLMDVPDDWGMELNIDRYEETFDRMISFAKDHLDALWCYGNHDVSYPWGQLAIMHRIDKVLFAHGGLTTEFVKWLNEDLLDADIDDVIAAVNNASRDYLWDDESPLWLRPQSRNRDTFRKDTYTQVVGHTPVASIFERDGIISTDVFSTYRDGKQIGESAMIVIDSATGKYEKILT